MRRSGLTLILAVLLCAAAADPLAAGGGPQNVLVICNAASDDAVAVANAYRQARGVPQRNVCRLNIPLETFRLRDALTPEQFGALVIDPLKAFLAAHPAADRLHYLVLCPDLPLRVEFDKPSQPRSLPAQLARVGVDLSRGTAGNPYVRQAQAFEFCDAGGDAVSRLRLVTVLAGWQKRDALEMIRRSVASDGTAPKGAFQFVPSPHTRGYEDAVTWLTEHGFEAALHEKDKPLTDAGDVMAYLSGGTYSGATIANVASNTYRPGCLVDMLESYGATWPTWRGLGYHRQLPVAWLLRHGATGVHGTTDEPYAGAFPSAGYARTMLANYTAGMNLAESFWSAIPVIGWQNVVFGDPLCAPYARRPKLTVASAGGRVDVTVVHDTEPAPKEVRLFIDGRFIGSTGSYIVERLGTAKCFFDIGPEKLIPGTHCVRAVAVGSPPAAVQSWATADLVTGDADAAPEIGLRLPPTKLALAAGDTILVTCRRPGACGAERTELFAGALSLGCLGDEPKALDTSVLGPGRHELQGRALDAAGETLALSNIVTLDLVEPLHVVAHQPQGETGQRPNFFLRYNAALPPNEEAVRRSIRVKQGESLAAFQCRADGDRLAVDVTRPLRPGVPVTLSVSLPQELGRSRDFTFSFTPSADADLLYTLSPDAPYTATAEGLTSMGQGAIINIWKCPARVVAGPVDLFTPLCPAEWSLEAYRISARLTIAEAARPEGHDNWGAGLGVLYTDLENLCCARVERTEVVLYQRVAAKTQRLAAWPAPGATTGEIAMSVTCRGRQVTVAVDGRTLGSATVDERLKPGLPWIDLGAGPVVRAEDVRISRP